MNPTVRPLVLLGSLLVGACGEPPPADAPPVDYHRDAVAILDRYCNDCHRQGGIAPFALTDYGSARAHAALIRGAVDTGRMPPWMPSDKGMPLRYARTMRQEDRQLLLRWIDAGAPEGDPAAAPRTDIPQAEIVAPPRPDLVVDTGVTYQPNQNLTDDYRCFTADPKLTEDTYIAAGKIVPGNAGIVHHAILYEIPARDADKVRQLDTADGGPGYTCFGGPGAGAQTVLVWAPGSVPMRAPEDLAVKLTKGSLLVVQIHYNLLNYQGAGDRTTVQLERSPGKPRQIAVLLGVAEPAKLLIKAGDAAAKQVISIPIIVPLLTYKVASLKIYGNVPHMHQLGTRITTGLADGRTLLEVPRWDFHWQQYYQFRQPIVVGASDTLVVECDYDNSAAHQPVVNGQRRTPRDVGFGERTEDEMCLSYVQVALDPATAL